MPTPSHCSQWCVLVPHLSFINNFRMFQWFVWLSHGHYSFLQPYLQSSF